MAVANGFVRTRQGEGGNRRRGTSLIQHRRCPLPTAGTTCADSRITHTNGPHPGTSPSGEAHFRVQAMTSAARYLIDRFMPAP